jgi:hypothetical protein
MNQRFCAYCGAVLVQRPSENDWYFARRSTCNFGCGAQLGHRRRTIKRALELLGITAEELDRRRDAGLCMCGKPLLRGSRGRKRRTCGNMGCRGVLQGPATGYAPGEHVLQWPEVTGEVAADFSAHNVDARDGGFGVKIVRGDDRSYVGCSLA